jgi:hypothetical protein
MKTHSLLRTTGSLLLALLLLLAACKRQGPMGPEGPQGPDGQDAAGGGGGGGITTYFTKDDDKIEWEGIDGWQGYGVYNLNINQYDWKNFMPLPETAASQIDAGGLVVVSLLMDDEWHALPYKDEFNNGKGTYSFYMNYEIDNGKLNITGKVLDDVEVILLDVQKVKVVVAPASQAIPLTL